MNDQIDFEDGAFVGRVQVWADARRRDDRAPERVVRAVLADVARSPRRRGFARLPAIVAGGSAAYAALAAILVVSVTAGMFLARTLEAGPGDSAPPTVPASPSPSPTPEPTPTPTPTLGPVPLELQRLDDLPLAAGAIGALGDDLWAVDPAGLLRELDPRTGATTRSIQLPRVPSALLVTDDAVWAASDAGDLVRVDRATLAIVEVAGTAGGALAVDGDTIWLGGTDEVIRIDAAAVTVTARVPVAGRDGRLGIAVHESGIWVATRAEIVQLDRDGAVLARIPGDATRIVVADGLLWARRGTELLPIEPATATIQDFLAGFPPGGPMLPDGDRLWIVGPPGGGSGEVVVFEPTTRRMAARGSFAGSPSDAAVTSVGIWITTQETGTILRFAIPAG